MINHSGPRFTHSMFQFSVLIIFISSLFISHNNHAQYVQAVSAKSIGGGIGYEFGELPLDAQTSLINAIQSRPVDILPGGTYFVVGTYESSANWGIGHLAAAVGSTPPNWDESVWFIVQTVPVLQVALEGTPLFNEILLKLPVSLAQQLAVPVNLKNTFAASTFQFPWDRTQKWRYTYGWHGSTGLALDFAPDSVIAPANLWIVASANGTVAEGCGDTYQSHLVLTMASGATNYGHTDYNSFHAQGIAGQPVVQGQKLAIAYNGVQGAGYYDTSKNWPWPPCAQGSSSSCVYEKFMSACGAGTGTHVHWTLPSKPYTVDGWQVDATSGIWTKSGQPSRGIGSYFTSTSLVNSILPTSRTPVVGSPVTIFNTVVNAGSDTAYGVTLSMVSPPAGSFSYNQTNCATNAVVGGLNPSIDIDQGGVACYLLTFTPSAQFAATNARIMAQASNAPSTNLLTGINTWLLRSTAAAGPDIIALTTTVDFHQVACSGLNAFAVALSNVGAAAIGDITAVANTGSASLPLSISISETNPGTGAIIGDNILQSVGAGANRTVAVFVTFNGCVSFDPAVNRIFIEFKDASNNVVGSTSTAVSTNR